MQIERHTGSHTLEQFIEIATALSSYRDFDKLLHYVVETGLCLCGAMVGTIYMLDNTKRFLVPEVFIDDNDGYKLKPIPLYAENDRNLANVEAYCAFTGKVKYVNNVYSYSGFDFAELYAYDRLRGGKSRSLIAIPLQDHAQITVGVLVFVNLRDGQDGLLQDILNNKENMFSAFALQAAIAIENLQLIRRNKQLINALNNNNHRLEKEYKELLSKLQREYDFSKIVGESEAMQKVFSLMEKVIDSQTTVTILGETGTGKELIAQALHKNSRRQAKPFVVQNCAALPENLLESELFGYKKGAFTGATADKKGLFEQAEGGTLFLDEIGDMPLGLQAKILRVLQEKEIRPLGDTRSRRVDVRIITATHCDLAKKVAEGGFREDLFYRLTIFPIDMPPLRARKEDLPALLNHFIKHFGEYFDKDIKGISPSAFDMLMAHNYPGNIRELKNIVERAVLLSEDGCSILPEHLPDSVHKLKVDRVNDLLPVASDQSNGLKEMLEKYEAVLIRDKLKACNWNQTRAATELNVARRTLISKINRYKIRKRDEDKSLESFIVH